MEKNLNISYLKYAFWGLIGVGVFLRIYKLGALPIGLNADEASIGYEAYSLLKEGTDRWGIKLPPYFLSFGSGQNTFYAYLSVPFLYFFELSQASIRYLATFLGLGTIPLVYFLSKRIFQNYNWALVCTVIYLFDPYHFMISRWALEYNILPFFVILSLLTFTIALDKNQNFNPSKKAAILFSLPTLALIIYTYASAIFIIPLFLLLLIWFYYNEILAAKGWFLASFGLFTLLITPFLLFILKNHVFKTEFSFEQYLPFEIPKMLSNREEVFKGIGKNLAIIKKNFVFVFSGFKEFDRVFNTTKFYTPHIFMLLAALSFVYYLRIIGLKAERINISKTNFILVLWGIACFMPFLFFEMNLNRSVHLQAIVPILSVWGLKLLIENIDEQSYKKCLAIAMAFLFFIQSFIFYGEYFNRFKGYDQFITGFEPALNAAKKNRQNTENVAITSSLVFNYLFVGFYDKYPPKTFQSSLKADFTHANVAVHSIAGYYFLGDIANFGYSLNGEIFEKLKKEKSFLAILKSNEQFSDYQVNNKSLIDKSLYSETQIYKDGDWKVVRISKI